MQQIKLEDYGLRNDESCWSVSRVLWLKPNLVTNLGVRIYSATYLMSDCT
jgi:hypothetical protein